MATPAPPKPDPVTCSLCGLSWLDCEHTVGQATGIDLAPVELEAKPRRPRRKSIWKQIDERQAATRTEAELERRCEAHAESQRKWLAARNKIKARQLEAARAEAAS